MCYKLSIKRVQARTYTETRKRYMMGVPICSLHYYVLPCITFTPPPPPTGLTEDHHCVLFKYSHNAAIGSTHRLTYINAHIHTYIHTYIHYIHIHTY